RSRHRGSHRNGGYGGRERVRGTARRGHPRRGDQQRRTEQLRRHIQERGRRLRRCPDRTVRRGRGPNPMAARGTARRRRGDAMSEAQARRLAATPAVAYVQRNGVYQISGTQPNPPSWGLDRIDQRNLPLDNSYTYPNTASNVHAYIIDTGIRRTHTDLGGRAV